MHTVCALWQIPNEWHIGPLVCSSLRGPFHTSACFSSGLFGSRRSPNTCQHFELETFSCPTSQGFQMHCWTLSTIHVRLCKWLRSTLKKKTSVWETNDICCFCSSTLNVWLENCLQRAGIRACSTIMYWRMKHFINAYQIPKFRTYLSQDLSSIHISHCE